MSGNGTANDVIGTVAHMKKSGILKLLLIALAVGTALFVIGSFTAEKGKDDGEADAASGDGGLNGFFEYKRFIENEIKELCMSVDGVNGVSVVAFFDDVGGSIYAQNTQSGTSVEKSEYVIVGSGSSSHALYIGEGLPSLSGIGVVCRSSAGDNVKNELAALLSGAYGLPLTRIYVSGS